MGFGIWIQTLHSQVWGRRQKDRGINEAGQQGKEDLGREGEKTGHFFSFTGFLSEDNFILFPLPGAILYPYTHIHMHSHTHIHTCTWISLYPAKQVEDEGQDLE